MAGHYTVTCLDAVPCQLYDIAPALQQLTRTHSALLKAPCVLVVPASTYQLLRLEVPSDLAQEEVEELVADQVEAQISLPLSEVVFDFFEPPDFAGSLRWVYVVVTEKNSVRRYTRPILDSGFNLQAVDIPEMALRNLLTLLPTERESHAILWINPHDSLLVFAHNQAICLTQRIAYGGKHLLHQMKSQGIFNGIDRMSADALRLIVQPLVVAVQQALFEYMQHFGLPAINRLVVAPIPQDMPQLPGCLTEALGVRTSPLILEQLLTLADSLPSQLQDHCLLSIGAALRKDE
jgi:MSHA biogenesis protein MshI